MRIGVNRRRVLGALTAGLFMGPAAASGPVPLTKLTTRQRWTTGNATLNPPAQGDGTIYFCGDKTIGAVRPGAEAPLWVRQHGFDSPSAYRPRLTASLMVTGGRRWIAAYHRTTGERIWHYMARQQTGVPLATDQITCFGDGHEIVALDTLTGEELWRAAGVPDTLASYAPVVAGDMIFAGPGDGRLYAMSASSGAIKWQVDGRANWQYLRQIHVDGDVLVAGTYKEKLYGLAVADGSPLWSFNAGNFINSHHVASGSAYLWSPTGWVYAIDTKTGEVRWRHQTTDYDATAANWASLMAELVTHDGKLYALDMDNVLHVLSLTAGEEIARAAVPARIRHAVLPVASSGLAFPVMGGDLLLTAFT